MPQIQKTFSIVGTMFQPGASDLIARLKPGNPLVLVRESNNKYDANAVLVTVPGAGGNLVKVGYLPRQLAAEIAPILDGGAKVICRRAHDARYGVCDLAYVTEEATS
jgi:hypothetical protein